MESCRSRQASETRRRSVNSRSPKPAFWRRTAASGPGSARPPHHRC